MYNIAHKSRKGKYLEIERCEVAKAQHEDGSPIEEDSIGEWAVRVDIHHSVVIHLRVCMDASVVGAHGGFAHTSII